MALRASLLCLILPLLLGRSSAQTLEEEINLAIDRGVDRLMRLQQADGSFALAYPDANHPKKHPMGTTSLMLYALVKSGLDPNDLICRKAVHYLQYLPFERVYCVGLYIMAMDAVGTSEHDERIRQAARWLEENINPKFDLWGYPEGTPDFSNTQYAVLGLWVAEQHGYEVKLKTWQDLAEATMKGQRPGGGIYYRYNLMTYPSGGMTTAGITVLELVLDRLKGRPPSPEARASLERAWNWLDYVFTTTGNPHQENGVLRDKSNEYGHAHYAHYYYLYGLERIAALAKRKEVGGRDWYREGAIYLLGQEDNLERGKKDGQSYTGDWGGALNTAFTLLFLRRATFSGLSGMKHQSGVLGAREWRYTQDSPGKGFEHPDFDDSAWKSGPGPFGPYRGAKIPVRTEWAQGDDLWVRRHFDWPGKPEDFKVLGFHDDSLELWINGVLAAESATWSTGVTEISITPESRATLKPQGNLMAAHVHDNGGARGLSLALHDLGGRSARQHESPVEARRRWWREPPEEQVPFISRWLVLDGLSDPDYDLLLKESWPTDRAPGANQSFKTARWKERRALGGQLEFARDGKAGQSELFHAFTWLEASESINVVLYLGAQEGFRVYLDDELLLSHHAPQTPKLDEWRIPMRLIQGRHRLLIKVESKERGAVLMARLGQRDGTPAFPIVKTMPETETRPTSGIPIADAEAFSLDELSRDLVIERKEDLRFDKSSDLDYLSARGGRPGWPRWIASHDRRGEGEQPPPGQRGILGIASRSKTSPGRILRRLAIPGGTPKLALKLAGLTGAEADGPGAILRVGYYDGAMHWLHEGEVPVTVESSTKSWQDLKIPLDACAGTNALLILECAATRDGPDSAVVFLDRMEIDSR
ncbi:MAG: terpene cyclase/mutase family protein [Planctomycetes bacterium]|nr:terpene cyclase/mutase family protein [Planctomycetota bacterium]